MTREGIKAYLRVPFVLIVWVMETFAKNRERLKIFMAQPRTAQVFKLAVIVTALVWVGIALMANDEHGQRLTDAVKGFWSDTRNLADERKTLQGNQ